MNTQTTIRSCRVGMTLSSDNLSHNGTVHCNLLSAKRLECTTYVCHSTYVLYHGVYQCLLLGVAFHFKMHHTHGVKSGCHMAWYVQSQSSKQWYFTATVVTAESIPFWP